MRMFKYTLAVLVSISLSACAPTQFRWYQPAGNGVLAKPGCGVPADEMNFTFDDAGSHFYVSVRPPDYREGDFRGGENTAISYSILLAAGASFQIVDPVFVLHSTDGTELLRFNFKTVRVLSSSDKPMWTEIPAGTELKTPMNVPQLKGYPKSIVEHYHVNVLFKSPPDRFQVRYPSYFVNGRLHQGPIVSYEKSEGTFLARRCFF